MKRILQLLLALAAGTACARMLDIDWSPKASKAAERPALNAALNAAPTCNSAAGNESATVAQLCSGKLRIIDLSWPLNSKSAYWPGDDYRPFELRTIATLEKNGVLSKAFCTPEHLGTHLDAPNHFHRGGIAVDQIPAEQLFAPGVVIDVSSPVSLNADYQLTAADVQAWEKIHGEIPVGAIVLLYTGWSRFWGDSVRYQNKDVMGTLHFPGFGPDAAKFLLAQRKIRGLGLDTLSIDHGPSRDFAVHHLVNGAGRFGLENVAHLDELPSDDFYLVVAPIKIETGSGGPARIFAIVP